MVRQLVVLLQLAHLPLVNGEIQASSGFTLDWAIKNALKGSAFCSQVPFMVCIGCLVRAGLV